MAAFVWFFLSFVFVPLLLNSTAEIAELAKGLNKVFRMVLAKCLRSVADFLMWTKSDPTIDEMIDEKFTEKEIKNTKLGDRRFQKQEEWAESEREVRHRVEHEKSKPSSRNIKDAHACKEVSCQDTNDFPTFYAEY